MKQVLLDECRLLGPISSTAQALVEYSCSLTEGQLQKESARYVMRPDNFVTFEPHYQRTNNLTVTLRGNPEEFEPISELRLKKSMNGYSIFILSQVSQLHAAASYINRARLLFERGRGRVQTTPQTIEQ